MAITNIFKKEEKKTIAGKRTETPRVVAQTKTSRKASGLASRVLRRAHVTEKASKLAEGNQYVFEVAKSANKKEIARAIESYYGVDVVGVNTIRIPGKPKRYKQNVTLTSGYRKAIVKIKQGQSIEVLPK